MCTMMKSLLLCATLHVVHADGNVWEPVGPWNLYDGTNPTESAGMGEAGTLATAASLSTAPDLIYAGGQNNGASSGVLKTIDGGIHWTRQSKGLWDTRVLALWLHPDDPKGGHVFAGTHTGIYESKDFAESWQLANETANWGGVQWFKQAVVDGKDYIVANANANLLTRPLDGTSPWQKAEQAEDAPGSYRGLSVVTTAGKSEVFTCANQKGKPAGLFFGAINSPTNVTWDEPLKEPKVTFTDWEVFNNTFSNTIYGITNLISPGCTREVKPCTNTSCPGIVSLGKMPTLEACQAAINASGVTVASWTYIHGEKDRPGGSYCPFFDADWQLCLISTKFATWTPLTHTKGPVRGVTSGRAPGTFGGGDIECVGAPAVDPNDRNHFIYAAAGYGAGFMHTEDGGKMLTRIKNYTGASYMSHIDEHGLIYAAGVQGAFVSEDKAATWNALHVMISTTNNCTSGFPGCNHQVDRVQHDFQNIVPFRDGVAFPSDQGLHIFDRTSKNYTLTSAVGDMHNSIALSVIISPSKDGKTVNIVANLWDWDVVVSFDGGASWQVQWPHAEKSPLGCGEGGGGQGLGSSSYQMMFHHSNWFSSADGGYTYFTGTLPAGYPLGSTSFDYVRTAGSRTQPSGVYFGVAAFPAAYSGSGSAWASAKEEDDGAQIKGEKQGEDGDEDEHNEHGEDEKDEGGMVMWMMKSEDFGMNFTYTKMPADLQASSFIVDPTSANSLYALAKPSSGQPNGCLAHSTTLGKDWSPCSKAAGLNGTLSQLVIKDSKTMFMMRLRDVPLKTIDGGSTWAPLSNSPAKLSKITSGNVGSLSWSGKTLVVHGADMSAIGRQERATSVFKSTDDGATWTDETGDIITVSPGKGAWFEKDFYLATGGQGILVKRNFELSNSADL